jgi:hypothetical protein
MVYADAGDGGEQIIRRTLEGLPRYLRPGGRFYSLQMTTEAEGDAFEDRIRKWLGPEQGEFDILLGLHAIRTKLEFFAGARHRGLLAVEGTRYWLGLSNAERNEYLIYVGVLIERHDRPREPLTRRVLEGEGYSGRELERLLEWHKLLAQPDSTEMLMACRPVAPEGMELHVVNRVEEKQFRPATFRVEVPGPFGTSLHCEEWMTSVLPGCDGVTTWREHFEALKGAGRIHPDVPEEAFAKVLGILVAGGILRVTD